MEVKRGSERCYHFHLTNECDAREMSEMMTNRAQGAPRRLGKLWRWQRKGENSSGVMELSGAHIIDLERALSFVSFKR